MNATSPGLQTGDWLVVAPGLGFIRVRGIGEPVKLLWESDYLRFGLKSAILNCPVLSLHEPCLKPKITVNSQKVGRVSHIWPLCIPMLPGYKPQVLS